MEKDRAKWNQKHRARPARTGINRIVEEYVHLVPGGKALDLACGMGRHTRFLTEKGFEVDAVDISDFAVEQVRDQVPGASAIQADLDAYSIVPDRYDLIVNISYLNRALFGPIREGLRKDGVLIFETFMQGDPGRISHPGNPDFLLQPNELLHAFSSFFLLYYDEREVTREDGEAAWRAALVARKI